MLCCPLDTGVTLDSSVRSESADERVFPVEIAGKQVIAGFTPFHPRTGVMHSRFLALTSGGSYYRPILPTREGKL